MLLKTWKAFRVGSSIMSHDGLSDGAPCAPKVADISSACGWNCKRTDHLLNLMADIMPVREP